MQTSKGKSFSSFHAFIFIVSNSSSSNNIEKKIIKNYIVHNEIKEEKIKIAIERSKCYAV